jgi:hypothetical protein
MIRKLALVSDLHAFALAGAISAALAIGAPVSASDKQTDHTERSQAVQSKLENAWCDTIGGRRLFLKSRL